MTIPSFNPSSWPSGCGVMRGPSGWHAVFITTEEIDQALDQLQLEKARGLIHHFSPNNHVKRQEQFLRLVEKLVEVNAQELSSEYQKLNYTLDAAKRLGDNMYTRAFSIHYGEEKKKAMAIAAKAIASVSDAYAKKNMYREAVDSLIMIDWEYRESPIKAIVKKWQTYIQTTCPEEDKNHQELLYSDRLKFWLHKSPRSQ